MRGLLERPDGNNVSLERESLLLAETQMRYNLGIQLLKDEFHRISQAINSGGTRHEPVWHARTQWLGVGRGALARRSGLRQYGQCRDHPYSARWSVPPASCWFSARDPCRAFPYCWPDCEAIPPKACGSSAWSPISPHAQRYEPGHPDADATGYVTYPNVNPVFEMADLLSAVRAYQVNVASVQAAKSMIQTSLQILS